MHRAHLLRKYPKESDTSGIYRRHTVQRYRVYGDGIRRRGRGVIDIPRVSNRESHETGRGVTFSVGNRALASRLLPPARCSRGRRYRSWLPLPVEVSARSVGRERAGHVEFNEIVHAGHGSPMRASGRFSSRRQIETNARPRRYRFPVHLYARTRFRPCPDRATSDLNLMNCRDKSLRRPFTWCLYRGLPARDSLEQG